MHHAFFYYYAMFFLCCELNKRVLAFTHSCTGLRRDIIPSFFPGTNGSGLDFLSGANLVIGFLVNYQKGIL